VEWILAGKVTDVFSRNVFFSSVRLSDVDGLALGERLGEDLLAEILHPNHE
jgi:hypothetical protein